MKPKIRTLLEGFVAADDGERNEFVKLIRKGFGEEVPAKDPDRAAVEAAAAELTVPTDNPAYGECLASADAILRAHFAGAITLRELSTKDVREPPPVLWQDSKYKNSVLSVGETAIMASPGGLGKSTLVLELAIAAVRVKSTAAQQFGTACGLRVRAGPVVLVSYEDSVGRIAARVSRMQPSQFPTRIHIWTNPDPLFIGDERGGAAPAPCWPALWTAVRNIKPSLVVVDPASAALTGVSMNDSGAVRILMRELAREATAAECGVLVVAHDTKMARNEARAGNNPGAGAIAGSATWHDASRGVLYLSREDDKEYRELHCIKANYGSVGWSVALHERTDPAGRFVGFRTAPSEASSPELNPMP